MGLISSMLNRHRVVSVVAAIAPFSEAEGRNRQLIGDYVEVFCDCPLDVLKVRDPKGVYGRAERGENPDFTGISSACEIPEAPEVHLYTGRETVEQSVRGVLDYLMGRLETFVPR